MHALLFLPAVVTAVVLNFPVTTPPKVAAHARRAQRVAQAKDSCLIKRSAHHRRQVERPVALRVGTSWPKDWREVTRPIFPATPTDSMVAGTLGVRPSDGSVESTLPREWAAFVVDTSGNVVACSFGSHDGLAADAPLARQLAQRNFVPAEVAGRPVPQLVVLQRRR